MNADGSDPKCLADTGYDSYPALSPDSTQIVFASSRDGNGEIYMINADGSGLTRLTNNPATDLYPAWSTDRKQIAFMSDRDGNSEIYIMNADGTGVTRLTDNPARDRFPDW
jgi:TolB protein